LGHSDGIAIGEIVAFNVGPQPSKCNTADDGFVGFASTVTPSIVVVEATVAD